MRQGLSGTLIFPWTHLIKLWQKWNSSTITATICKRFPLLLLTTLISNYALHNVWLEKALSLTWTTWDIKSWTFIHLIKTKLNVIILFHVFKHVFFLRGILLYLVELCKDVSGSICIGTEWPFVILHKLLLTVILCN